MLESHGVGGGDKSGGGGGGGLVGPEKLFLPTNLFSWETKTTSAKVSSSTPAHGWVFSPFFF